MGDYVLSNFGLSRVIKLRAERENGPARMSALRNSLVLWLYDQYLAGAVPASTEGFSQTNRSSYLGRPFGSREVGLAVEYLYSAGLISGVRVNQSNHLLSPSLSVRGVDCAESEKAVSEFLNPPASSGPTFNVRVDGSQNVVVGTQSDFTQNNASGIDPAVLAQLSHFAGVARQGAPSYGLEEEQQVEVERLAEELEAEAGSDSPDRGRLRGLTDRLVAALAPAAGTALGGMVMSIGEQAAQAIAG
ncbi:hypothetical protein JHN55_09470 [Streptomyces sp. MBT56]|uniref:hypothetical protein n=1 Tax=unclassified Streptomyces TaxID=2593676 RepID=UPI00190A088D|nr:MULTISPECIES: hypothetical protein [unclassified Streptomyces]MBK3556753.1 hypothetical protein [Streptomyces sp. MBT56]MBK3600260.1 hypothetical protein [Streptomyces sp. MBT54]MBK3613738.1 hypothetical protein [Streptomyces sp. MBT98]